MTISRTVYNQLFEHSDASEHVIRLQPTEAKAGAVVVSAKSKIQMWTQDEHERFLVALEMFPAGPWKNVADYIGTKTPRQTMTHAQKYRQKISRRQRGLRNRKTTPPIDSPTAMASEFGDHALRSMQPSFDVADVCVKNESSGQLYQPMHGVAATHAMAAADPSLGRLDMLARAMQMQRDVNPNAFACTPQGQSQSMEMMISSHEGAGSPNTALPSLAQILNLRSSSTQPSQPQQSSCSCNCSHASGAQQERGCHASNARL